MGLCIKSGISTEAMGNSQPAKYCAILQLQSYQDQKLLHLVVK